MCLHILACLCPPLAVCFKRGVGCDCCVNCLLTSLVYVPGCCHACYIVSQDDSTHVNVNQTVVVQQPQQNQTIYAPPQQPMPTYYPPQQQPMYPPQPPPGHAYGQNTYPPQHQPHPMYPMASSPPPSYPK